MTDRIVPHNFATLVRNVIPAPNYLWTIASNTCSVKPYLFVETMFPAALFLFTRLVLLEMDDLIIDAGRRAAGTPVGARRKKTRRGVRNLGPRQGPVRSVGLRRFLFFPLGLVERAGYTFLLASFASDLAYAWTSILARCDECADTGESLENGPLIRSIVPGVQFLNEGWEGIPMTSLDQNRAGWTTTLQSVGLPFGSWNIVVSATVRKSGTATRPFQGRLLVRRTILGFPVTQIADFQELTMSGGINTDMILAASVWVPPGNTVLVTWQWQTLGVGINIITRIDGDCMVTGQSTCAT